MNVQETPPTPDEIPAGTRTANIPAQSLEDPLALEFPALSLSPDPAQPSETGTILTTSKSQNVDQKSTSQDRSSFQILLMIGVGFVALFLFLRTFAIEPFGVPTGSMAPALIGNHREGSCSRCGYPVRVGFPSAGGNAADQFGHIGCPNCAKKFSLVEARDLSGDRLLVDKNVFNIRGPRRWEMAVFRCPDSDPKEFGKPYVKRVIGLPGETIQLIDGDVYANGILMRKDVAEVRETGVLVFDMSHVPNPGGWNSRWLVEPPENDPRLPQTTARPLVVADSSVVRGEVLTLDASDPAQPSAGIRYRHWNLDERKEESIRAWSSYDGIPRSFSQLPLVHDFSVSFEIEVVSATGGASFTCELSDGADTIQAEISVGARVNGLASLTRVGQGELGTIRGVSLEAGGTYRLEFAFVDRRASLAIDGKLVLPPTDLPQVDKRDEVRNPVQMGARGCKLAIRGFALYRDTYYTQFGEHGTLHPAVLGLNEFFVLGDNSGNSQDSRKWPTPGVPEKDFIGKPFLIHQPLRPARLTIGGQERVFQTVDWSRLRWLH
jgi:signal peptidase I